MPLKKTSWRDIRLPLSSVFYCSSPTRNVDTLCTLVAVRKIIYITLFRWGSSLKVTNVKTRICYKLTFHAEVLSNYNSVSPNRTLNLFWLESYNSFLCGSLKLSSVSFSYKFRFQLLVRCPGRFLGARERSHFSSAHSFTPLAAVGRQQVQ